MSLKLRKLAKTVKTQGPQERTFRFDRSSVDTEARTVELSFSSETRDVVRWFGIEVLGHNENEVRLGRINTGGPVLVDHKGDQVGVVERAWIDEKTRKGRALVRFSQSARGDEVFQDVQDGIRQNVSFAYDVYRYILEEEGKNGAHDVLRAVDWEPLEISIVSMPADITVGVGRSRNYEPREIEIYQYESEGGDGNNHERGKGGSEEMKCTKCGKDLVDGKCPDCDGRSHTPTGGGAAVGEKAEDVRTKERKRIQEIQTLTDTMRTKLKAGKDLDDLSRKFINEGGSVEDFSVAVLRTVSPNLENTLPSAADVVLNEREAAQYSVLRGVMSSLGEGEAGFEMEVSQEIARKLGRSSQGFFVPTSLRSGVQGMRAPVAGAAVAGTSGAGGYTVPTELQPIIEALYGKMLLRKMGAQTMSGLSGNIPFPKELALPALQWFAENGGDDIGETDLSNYFGQIALTPKQAGSTLTYSRMFLQQTALSAEAFFRNRLALVGALGLDKAAIQGTGAGNQPRGILSTSGVGLVECGVDGAVPTWGNIVGLETDVSVDNADYGSLGYLTTPDMRGKLKTVLKAAAAGSSFIWEKGSGEFGEMNGYRAGATTQVPNNLEKGLSGAVCSAIIFGNFNEVVIGEYGALEIIADPYRLKKQGLVEITSNLLADVLVLRAAAFAAIKDGKTA